MMKEAAYWIALSHLSGWGYLKTNNLIIKFFHENNISIEEFFMLDEKIWKEHYQLDERQVSDLKKSKSEVANHAFLAESFYNQGYEIIPIISPEYSKALKNNLKAAHSPAVLYIKGNKKILNEMAIAIVGSRQASDLSLKFTDNLAKLASKEYKVIVSGFAKGVDKQALDSAINYKGQSIIVLPQGIMTFGTGFKNYYKQIIAGDVLVLSTYFPKAPWKVEQAMARNPIIYGLANEIYVAESSDKGGTWSGVLDGLRKGRKIYVRKPEPGEHNANQLLIQRGAIPVDFNGITLTDSYQAISASQISLVREADNQDSLEQKIRIALSDKPLSAAELLDLLNLSWTQNKLTSSLRKMDFVEIIKSKRLNLFKLKASIQASQTSLFS